MSEINYAQMSDQELRQYFLEHKNDQSALQAYLERRNQQPREVITKVGDPDFDVKIEQVIKGKIRKGTKKYLINLIFLMFTPILFSCSSDAIAKGERLSTSSQKQLSESSFLGCWKGSSSGSTVSVRDTHNFLPNNKYEGSRRIIATSPGSSGETKYVGRWSSDGD